MRKGTLFFAHMQIYSYLCTEIYEPRSKGRNYFTIMANEKQQFVDELKELLQKNVAEVKEQVEAVKTQFYRQ